MHVRISTLETRIIAFWSETLPDIIATSINDPSTTAASAIAGMNRHGFASELRSTPATIAPHSPNFTRAFT